MQIADLIANNAAEHFPLNENDCIVVASKVVAKAQGRIYKLQDGETKLDIVVRESKRILRQRDSMLITETNHGFICANAGIDESNCEEDELILLPENLDSTANGLRKRFESITGFNCPFIISDTFGRPFREGQINVALGFSGLKSIADYRGEIDFYGNELINTQIAIPDEIAAAAELVMKKSTGICAVIVRGIDNEYLGNGKGSDLIRNPRKDLFR